MSDILRCKVSSAIRNDILDKSRGWRFPRFDPLRPDAALAAHERGDSPQADTYILAHQLGTALAPAVFQATATDLARFDRTGGPSLVLVEDVPCSPLPEPWLPVAGQRNPDCQDWLAEVMTFALLAGGGQQPMAKLEEAGNELLMAVSPVPELTNTLSSKGAQELRFHTDNSYFPARYRPDSLVLTGRVATEATFTRFVLADDLATAMARDNPAALRTLTEPRFRFWSPASFHIDGTRPRRSAPGPILTEDAAGQWTVNFSRYNLCPQADMPEVAAALAALDDALADERLVTDVAVRPGTMVLLSNRRVLHARGPVKGRRYLVRGYGKRDLGAFRTLPSGADRTFFHRFSVRELLKTRHPETSRQLVHS
ncbi:MAG TPA: TauD/TfdA family dioxygenase [Gemmataceae bacterium]|jgi:hypothetical protein|nr:TauD/TfdA family dioxygenase [Gemmataceae bacterium]